jgi:phosphoesterase RecJ-like protein
MDSKTTIEILQALRNSTRVLITSHREPDGDSICSQLVVREYLCDHGKECVIYNHGDIPTKYRSVKGVEYISSDISQYDFQPDLVVVLETTHIERTGDIHTIVKPGIPIVNIDHHQGNQFYGSVNLVDEKASSVGEMIYKIFESDGYEFSDTARENIYIAILTDTGRFHFSSTTPDALRIAAALVEGGVDVRRVTDQIYFSMNEHQLRVIGAVMQDAELHYGNRICALTLTRKLLVDTNMSFADFEGIVDYSLQVSGVRIGLLFKDTADTVTKVSLRSRGNVDVSALARSFGGGGHANAAGITLNLALTDAKDLIVRKAGELVDGHD